MTIEFMPTTMQSRFAPVRAYRAADAKKQTGKLKCLYKGCGRSFPSQLSLGMHIRRTHERTVLSPGENGATEKRKTRKYTKRRVVRKYTKRSVARKYAKRPVHFCFCPGCGLNMDRLALAYEVTVRMNKKGV